MPTVDGYDPWKHVHQLEGELEAAEQHVKILRSVHHDLDCKIIGLELELKKQRAYRDQRDYYAQLLYEVKKENTALKQVIADLSK